MALAEKLLVAVWLVVSLLSGMLLSVWELSSITNTGNITTRTITSISFFTRPPVNYITPEHGKAKMVLMFKAKTGGVESSCAWINARKSARKVILGMP